MLRMGTRAGRNGVMAMCESGERSEHDGWVSDNPNRQCHIDMGKHEAHEFDKANDPREYTSDRLGYPRSARGMGWCEGHA